MSDAARHRSALQLRTLELPYGISHDDAHCLPRGVLTSRALSFAACLRIALGQGTRPSRDGLGAALRPLRISLLPNTVYCEAATEGGASGYGCSADGMRDRVPMSIVGFFQPMADRTEVLRVKAVVLRDLSTCQRTKSFCEILD